MSDQKFVLPTNVLLQEVNDEIILLNLETEYYYSLDPVGSRFLRVLLEAEFMEQALEKLEAEYDVSREILDHDVRVFLDNLKGKGLLDSQLTE